MPANTIPITPVTQNVGWGKIVAGNVATDGTGATTLLFTAGANGSRIDQIRIAPLGANAVASVLRLFINNGNDPIVAANNTLVHEVTLPISTLVQNAATSLLDLTIPKNTTETACPIPYLKPNERIYASVGTAGTAGWQVTVHGADY